MSRDLPGQFYEFDVEPPTRNGLGDWEIVRVKGEKPQQFIVLSPYLLGINTHFWGGRTMPCPGVTICPACKEQQAPRWLGYLACTDLHYREKWVVEFGAKPASIIWDHFRQHRTLRAMGLTLWRKSKKSNAAVAARTTADIGAAAFLPEAPDLRSILFRIWQLRPGDDQVLVNNLAVRPPVADQGKPDFGDEAEESAYDGTTSMAEALGAKLRIKKAGA